VKSDHLMTKVKRHLQRVQVLLAQADLPDDARMRFMGVDHALEWVLDDEGMRSPVSFYDLEGWNVTGDHEEFMQDRKSAVISGNWLPAGNVPKKTKAKIQGWLDEWKVTKR